MPGIGIITNPHSKLNKRNPSRTALLGYILGERGTLEVTNSLEDLSRVAREFKERSISILAINGGDGTICRTLTAFLLEYSSTPLPQVVLLRGGTINVLANNLGIKGTPEQILYRLVEAHSSGKDLASRKLRGMWIEGEFGFLFGNGVAAAFLKEYYRRKSGPVGAFLWVMAVWLSFFFGGRLYNQIVKDLDFRIVAPDRPVVAHTTTAIFVSTLVRLPLGYPLFRMLKKVRDQFQLVSFIFPARSAVWQLPITLARIFEDVNSRKFSLTAGTVKIEAEQPFDYTLDGELHVSASSSLEITIGPEIEFIKI